MEGKEDIPEGPYCYTFIEPLPDGLGYKTKPCPHYKHVDGLEGHCALLDCEITDQVKECGINWNNNENENN